MKKIKLTHKELKRLFPRILPRIVYSNKIIVGENYLMVSQTESYFIRIFAIIIAIPYILLRGLLNFKEAIEDIKHTVKGESEYRHHYKIENIKKYHNDIYKKIRV